MKNTNNGYRYEEYDCKFSEYKITGEGGEQQQQRSN